MAGVVQPSFVGYAVGLAVLASNVRACLVKISGAGAYTRTASDVYLSSVPDAARLATSAVLSGKTVSAAGVFTASPYSLEAVVAGSTCGIVYYLDTGNAATSRIISYFPDDAGGNPITTDGEPMNMATHAITVAA